MRSINSKTQSKRLQKLQNRAARITLDASNDVNHTIALLTLGWEPLSMERKKAKAKIMFKILNNMGPRLLIYFHIKVRKLSIIFETNQKVSVYQNLELIICKRASCMTVQNFRILFLKTSGKVNHFLPFTKKSLFTLPE